MSDRTSDVCSSDLLVTHISRRTSRPADLAVRLLTHAIGRGRRRRQAAAGRFRLVRAGAGDVDRPSSAGAGERKSAVSAQNVTVRVALGGLLTTKTTTKSTTRHTA